jgi:acetyltransferase-like isoleucine patch superfamily enzyme
VTGPPSDVRAAGWRDRWRLFRARGVEAGDRVRVGAGVRFEVGPGARVVIGDDAVLGDGCVFAVKERVAIGHGCVLADGVVVVDFDHRFGDVEAPVRLQGLEVAPVTIEDGARLGPGAVVLRGVTVGAGAVVAAHAVVTRDVPAGGVVEGAPARAPN